MSNTNDDVMVTVCTECRRASCWYGELPCAKARTADVVKVKRSTLLAEKRESPHYLSDERIEKIMGRTPKQTVSPKERDNAIAYQALWADFDWLWNHVARLAAAAGGPVHRQADTFNARKRKEEMRSVLQHLERRLGKDDGHADGGVGADEREVRIVDADGDEAVFSWAFESDYAVGLLSVRGAHGEVLLSTRAVAKLRTALDRAEAAWMRRTVAKMKNIAMVPKVGAVELKDLYKDCEEKPTLSKKKPIT